MNKTGNEVNRQAQTFLQSFCVQFVNLIDMDTISVTQVYQILKCGGGWRARLAQTIDLGR